MDNFPDNINDLTRVCINLQQQDNVTLQQMLKQLENDNKIGHDIMYKKVRRHKLRQEKLN